MKSSNQTVYATAVGDAGALGLPSGAGASAGSRAEEIALGGARISARLDRLPATRSIWKLVMLLSLGLFFELYDLMFSGYIAPGLVRSGILTATTHGLFGTSGVASFIAALFAGLFIGTAACGFLADRFGRRAISRGRCFGTRRRTSSWRFRTRRSGSIYGVSLRASA